MVDRLEAVRVPTIARLQGGVYGGATDLALACDFRIGHEGIEMVMPAGRLGVHYYASGLRRYVSRLGLNTAKRLFLTAERLDAAGAVRRPGPAEAGPPRSRRGTAWRAWTAWWWAPASSASPWPGRWRRPGGR